MNRTWSHRAYANFAPEGRHCVTTNAQEAPAVSTDLDRGLEWLRQMLLIREFDLAASELCQSGAVPGHVHTCVGQEAVAVGVCSALRTTDFIASTHRGHGHMLAKGGDPGQMFAELYGYENGSNRGKGGSLHIVDIGIGMLGAFSVLASGIPVAVGAALNAWERGTDQVAVAFLGDGAINEGILYESLNLASVNKLPVLFVCENNLYTTRLKTEVTSGTLDLARRAEGFGLPCQVVDGNDVGAVAAVAEAAVARARAGEGPTFIEAKTYRLLPHNTNFVEDRDPEEVAAWRVKDPVNRLRDQLLGIDASVAPRLEGIQANVAASIQGGLAFAREGHVPLPESALDDVFAPPYVSDTPGDWSRTVELTGTEALRQAVSEELDRDPAVFLFAVEYGVNHGVYTGLPEKYGERRVLSSPISEAIIAGAANGAALTGGRPIVEIEYVDFCTLSMDQIVNVMAKHRYITGGQVTLPLVLRTQYGGNMVLGATHCQSLEALFYHVPGLKVVIPSNPADAKGLLKSAIRDDNPVLFLEPRSIYDQVGAVPVDEYTIPLGVAAVPRRGDDVSVIAFGAAVPLALHVAEELSGEGISAEVIDLRTIVPLDVETVLASVRKTHRAVIVQQASVQGGIGSDLCRMLNDEAWEDLQAPVLVVGSKHVPMPFSPELKKAVLFNEQDLIAAIRRVVPAAR